MKKNLIRPVFFLLTCSAFLSAVTDLCGESTPSDRTASIHAGFFYPNGVDIAGYTVEHKFKEGLYGFYTFGFPSFAAAGMAYYSDYHKNGLSASAGVGIGSIFYSSLVYQIRVADRHFLKLGGGYTTGIAYSGAYPSASYEFRF